VEVIKSRRRKAMIDFFTGEDITIGETSYQWNNRFGRHFSRRKPSQREMRISLGLRALYSGIEGLERLTEWHKTEDFIREVRVALARAEEAILYYQGKREGEQGPLYALNFRDWEEQLTRWRDELIKLKEFYEKPRDGLTCVRRLDIALTYLPRMGN